MIGCGRDITPGGIGLVLPECVERGAAGHVLLTLPSLDAGRTRVPVEVEVVSCRPGEHGWVAGTRIVEATSEVRHRILEYCFVTAPSQRLRGSQQQLRLEPARTVAANFAGERSDRGTHAVGAPATASA
jgi:hypothetical protein